MKVRVANITEGTTVRPGLDVDFLIERSNDQPTAIDVAYRGITEKGAKQMRRIIVGASVALIIVVALLAGTFRPWEWQSVKAELMSVKLEQAISRLEGTALATLVSDDVIRKAIRRGGETYAARAAFFDKYLCPVFNSPYYDEIKQTNDTVCFDALYASGGDGVSENPWYEKAGIPRALAPRVHYFRETALANAVEVLNNPGALTAFFEAKKQVVIAAYRASKPETQQSMLNGLRSARMAFLHLGDNRVQAALEAFLSAQEAWRNFPDKNGGADDALWKAYRDRESDLHAVAESVGTDSGTLRYAQRRYKVRHATRTTYLEIVDQLLAAAESKN
jgi:hypothetical protein